MTSVSAGTGPALPPSVPAAASIRTRPQTGWQSSARLGLVWTLVRTDFKARYHGTFSGFVWALLKPLAMFVVLMLVFSLLFATDPAYKLNLITGLFLWDFFAEGTKTGLASLQAKAYLLTKAKFPAWILVVTSISNAVITLVAFTLIMLIFLISAGHPPSLAAFALFVGYCAGLIAVVIGFSLTTSVLFLRYRDLNQVWDVIVQAGFFVSPIVYPLGIIPERYHVYLYLWPPTPFIQFSRAVLVAGSLPTLRGHLYLAAASAACMLVGVLVFRRLGPRAAEHL